MMHPNEGAYGGGAYGGASEVIAYLYYRYLRENN
jgi:hypothetical protein